MGNRYPKTGNTCIPSPYNFVPLSKTIVFPEWADQVSHDAPFRDGVSGELFLTIESMSPIYVRNGGSWSEEDRKDETSSMHDFFKSGIGPDGAEVFLIPGSSLKGIIRNVTEIVTFGKMARVSDHRYSIRDLYYHPYTDKLTHGSRKTEIVPLSKAGWLKSEGDRWYLTPCRYARIEQRLLGIGNSRCSAVDKYGKYKGQVKGIRFTLSKEKVHSHRKGELHIRYDKVESLGNGELTGTLVFTGQPNKTKHMEFVFYSDNDEHIDVTELRKDFEFIHSEPDGTPNVEWKYWKSRLDKGKVVPVFYLTGNDTPASSTDLPESMGLAMMYRLPYKYSIGDTVCHTNKEHFPKSADSFRPDMSDLMFGYCRGRKALRGRIQVGHFIEPSTSRERRGNSRITTIRTVLGEPKPTYYPNYLKQNHKDGMLIDREYKTYMDKAEVRGWKRYPVREIADQPSQDNLPRIPRDRDGRENRDIAVYFRPLPKGVVFEGRIRFHNLKKEELGALLWVLTWGSNGNRHHQVGMAKPLGYGRIKISIDKGRSNILYPESSKYDWKGAEKAFTDYMKKEVEGWDQSDQIIQLIAMADSIVISDIPMTYPELSVSPPRNQFTDFKYDQKVLKAYSGVAASRIPLSESRIHTQKEKESIPRIILRQESESTDPVEELLASAREMKDKTLRKELDKLESVSSDQLRQLESIIAKRSDFSRKQYLQDERDWSGALARLKDRLNATGD